MDLSLAPYLAMFLGALGLDLGMFSKPDDSTQDAAPETDSETDDSVPTTPTADGSSFQADDYSDVVAGTDGNDTLSAEAEEDLAWFLGEGDDQLDGSEGDDFASGGAGDDVMTLRDGRDVGYGGAGDDHIDLGIGADTGFGGEGNDLLSGNGGADLIYGEAGNDSVVGGTGADTLHGGDGDDTLAGMAITLSTPEDATVIDGIDQMFGGAGNDALRLGPGDIATGGDGNDRFVIDHERDEFTQISQITDYAAGDSLEVLYTPETDAGGAAIAPEVTLLTNPAGSGVYILFNGTPIADVLGGQTLTVGQIRLTAAA